MVALVLIELATVALDLTEFAAAAFDLIELEAFDLTEWATLALDLTEFAAVALDLTELPVQSDFTESATTDLLSGTACDTAETPDAAEEWFLRKFKLSCSSVGYLRIKLCYTLIILKEQRSY